MKTVGKPFQKGQSGNPGGRPKTKAIRESVLEHFERNKLEAIGGLYKEELPLYFAYAFGKPVESIELSRKDGGDIEVEHASADDLRAELIRRGSIIGRN
ncbi:MAG: DUF5681 domain-containing protein [Verrucomicrobiota bacterium]